MQPRMLRASSAAASACLPTDDASMQAPTFLWLSPLEAREATANRTLNAINGVAHMSTYVRLESCLLLLRGRDHRCHLVNRKLVDVTDPCQKPLGIGGGLDLSDQYTRQIRRQLQRRATRNSVRRNATRRRKAYNSFRTSCKPPAAKVTPCSSPLYRAVLGRPCQQVNINRCS